MAAAVLRNRVRVIDSCLDCSVAIALSEIASEFTAASDLRRSAIPPPATSSSCTVFATSSSRCEIVSARAVSSGSPAFGIAGGTLSPSWKKIGLGSAGISAIS